MNSFSKGQNCAISQEIDSILLGLDWGGSDAAADLDVSAFLLYDDEKVRSDDDFIFYNQPLSVDNEVSLSLDSRDSQYKSHLKIDLSKLGRELSKIVVSITIDTTSGEGNNFADFDPLCLELRGGGPTGELMARYRLEDAEQESSLMMCEVYRHGGGWKFRVVAQGYNGGLGVIASRFGVQIGRADEAPEARAEALSGDETVGLKKNRRSVNQVFADKALRLKSSMQSILPQIQAAVSNKENESNTRMILDKIFTDIFEYKMEEVKAEQKIQGRKADYVLSVDGKDLLVVEAKKAGMQLRDKQIFQATSYGACSGIKWVLLTNLNEWQLFHVSTEDKVEGNLIFAVDLLNDTDIEHFERLLLLSRYGITKDTLLEKLRLEVNTLSHESIISTMLSEAVINKIRLSLKKDTGCSVSNEQVQQVVESILNIN